MKNTTKTNVETILTERVIKLMEETKQLPWERPWKQIAPRSYASKKNFNLINSMLLDHEGEYITYYKAKENGWSFKDNAQCEQVFQKFVKKEQVLDKEGNPVLDKEGNPKERVYFYMKYTNEYPITYCIDENGNPIAPTTQENELTNYDCEAIVENYFKRRTDIRLERSDNYKVAKYTSKQNNVGTIIDQKVCVPNINRFHDTSTYYSTLFHEMTHSTGNALGRQLKNNFGDTNYAYEELVAELGAWILRGITGIETPKAEQNSATYLNSWIKQLSDNPKWIYNAMANAQKAVEYILEGYEQPKEETKEEKVVEKTTFLTSDQKRGLKKILTSAKKIAKRTGREVLQKYGEKKIYEDTYNVVTDSYCLYATKSDISEIFEKDTEDEYPQVNKLVPYINEDYKSLAVNTLDIKEIKERAKASLKKDEEKTIFKLTNGINVQAKLLLTVIECMNYKHDNVTIYYKPNDTKPLLLFNEKTDDIGLLMPVRTYGK